MKKFFLAMLTVAMATCFAACKNDGSTTNGDKAEGDNAAVENAQGQPAEVPTVSLDELKTLMEQMKTNGKDWTADQWKDAIQKALAGMKPMFDVLLQFQNPEMQKKLEEHPEDAAKIMGDIQKQLQSEDMKTLDALYKDFNNALEKNATAKEVLADTTWLNQAIEKVGLPKDTFKDI